MKNIFFALVAIFAISCSNSTQELISKVEALKPTLETTASNLTDLQSMITGELSNIPAMIQEMTADSVAISKLGEEQKNMVSQFVAQCNTYANDYTTLAGQINNHMNDWTTKASEFAAIESALTAGTVDATAGEQLAAMETFATETAAKIDTWKTAFEATKTACTQSMESLKGVIAPAAAQ